MKELQDRLLKLYENTIIELEQIDFEHKEFLKKATDSKNVPQEIVEKRMTLARDNHRRLQNARAEMEHIEGFKFI